MEHFTDLQKAHDYAKWLSFKYRQQESKYGVVHGPCDDYVVCDKEFMEDLESKFISSPNEYTAMTYDHIQSIYTDDDPLRFMEEIKGMVATVHGETLRFLLHYKIPLDKWIRYELASRGYDLNHEWVGFDKAEEIWLTDN